MGDFLTLLTSLTVADKGHILQSGERLLKRAVLRRPPAVLTLRNVSVNDKQTADGRLAGLREERRGFALCLSLF